MYGLLGFEVASQKAAIFSSHGLRGNGKAII